MKALKLSQEKRGIINALLADENLTVDELLRSHELAAAHRRTSPEKRYLSVAEVCRLCSVSRFTIRRWAQKHLVRTCKISNARGGRVLVDADSLADFLESRSQDDASDRNA